MSPLPAPDFLAYQLPEGHCCLITDDGSGASAELAAILSRRGWPVVLMSFPPSVVAASTPSELPAEIARVALPSTSEAHLREQLEAVAKAHGPVGAFIHVHPHTDEHARLVYFDDRDRALVKAVFLMAKHLQLALTAAAAQVSHEQGRAAFLTVTRMDGALGLSDTSEPDIIAGGLAGLTKSLQLEWPAVFCRAVDVDPTLAPERAAQAIFAELHDPNRRIVEVGVRLASEDSEGNSPIRSTITREKVGRNDIPTVPTTDQQTPPDADAVFLVSGGAKGITAKCVIAAARRYHSAFVLVGRSVYSEDEPEPAWSVGVTDEKALKQRAMAHLAESGERPTPKQIGRMVKAVRSRREIGETLAAIEQAGGRAVYVSADVTDGAALQAGVEAALHPLGASQITGLIHGAGAIADKPIQQKSAGDFELVYGVKIDGLKNLLSCAPPETLTHVVLFSSVAGFYGNAAQTDYALANEILNKIAHQLRREHPACHVCAIDWGPWDGGMVTPTLKRLMARRGIEVIPIETGADIFAAELASDADAAQIVVGSALAAPARTPDERLRTYRLRRRLSLEANPFLRDHVIGGSAVLPTVCAVGWVANACEQLTPGYTFFRAWEYKALKGIVFDESLADEYVLTLEETAKSADEIVFKAIISSQTKAQRPRYHYSVEITLRRELPAPPRYADVNLAATHDIAGAQLYEDVTLFHGPAFQGVDRLLNIGPDALTMRCLAPEVSCETQGQFTIQSFNPYLTDTQLQSLLIWATHTYGYGGLPLKIQEGKQYRPVPSGEPVYVSMTVQSNSERQLVADVTAHDADGLVYSQVSGAEITLSPRLNQLFAQNQLWGTQ